MPYNTIVFLVIAVLCTSRILHAAPPETGLVEVFPPGVEGASIDMVSGPDRGPRWKPESVPCLSGTRSGSADAVAAFVRARKKGLSGRDAGDWSAAWWKSVGTADLACALELPDRDGPGHPAFHAGVVRETIRRPDGGSHRAAHVVVWASAPRTPELRIVNSHILDDVGGERGLPGVWTLRTVRSPFERFPLLLVCWSAQGGSEATVGMYRVVIDEPGPGGGKKPWQLNPVIAELTVFTRTGAIDGWGAETATLDFRDLTAGRKNSLMVRHRRFAGTAAGRNPARDEESTTALTWSQDFEGFSPAAVDW